MIEATRDVGIKAGGVATVVLAMIPWLLPAGAMAQDDSLCWQSIMALDYSVEVHEARDLGQGLVQELSTGSEGSSGSDMIAFQQCESGRIVTAVASSWTEGETVLAPANPHDVMMMAMESATAFSMADIAQKMTGAGIEAELSTTTYETCGCAAFYPDLRGDKSPWSW